VNIDVSFVDGVPVLRLEGRFDGVGAVAFDERTGALDTAVVHWVIDVSGLRYLSSLGIRSIVVLEKRLKAHDGGLVLAGPTPPVQNVLRLSGLEGFLRIEPTASRAIEQARAAAAAEPVIEVALGCCGAKIRRLSGGESSVEWWAADGGRNSQDPLLSVDARDLGISFGIGVLGSAASSPGTPGPFVCTPQFAGVLDTEGGITDFIVGDASQAVPVGVATALGLWGSPAAIVELEGPSAFSLFDAIDELFPHLAERSTPATLGFVALAHTQGRQPGLLATGISFDPRSARNTIGLEERLKAMPGQLGLKSSRCVGGVAVTLNTQPALPRSDSIDRVLRGQAPLDALGGIVALDTCPPVTKALIWAFVPRELRSGSDKLLQVAVEGGGEWRPEWDAIVRRLYNDCRSVTLTPLHGGYMSSTFKAVAYDHDGRRTLPSVVKIGQTELTRREQQANRDYVSRFILNNGTTVLGDAQHGDWAGLRYNFLGVNGPDSRLVWLYDRYLERPVPEMTALIERLFTGVLKPWYAQPKWERVFLFRDHSPLRLFPAVIETAEEVLGISPDSPEFDCHELGLRLPNPFRFLKYEYPRRAGESRLWYTGVCHGDLNLRNVLVDERDNLYVIDFSETQPRNIVSDFARLEPVLKFELTRLDDEEDLRHLLEFEAGVTSVTALDQPPPFRYRGNDPLVARAHAAITLLRRYADRATLFETDIVPYWVAMLEWTYSVICYRQASVRQKRYAACSAALICRSILELEAAA
jgi:anti-anti-sigma factor